MFYQRNKSFSRAAAGSNRHISVIAASRAVFDDRCMQESEVLVLLVYDNHQLLDFAGPAEVFSVANTVLGYRAYARVVVSPDRRRVRSSSGVEIGVDRSLRGEADLVMAVDGYPSLGDLTTEALRRIE
jgi:transcriptional regulator GlxA family with amidase domain